MKEILLRKLNGEYVIASEKEMHEEIKAFALRYGKPFITIDQRHIDQRINIWQGDHLDKWIAFSEALDHLIDAGEIYCAILTERDEDESK